MEKYLCELYYELIVSHFSHDTVRKHSPFNGLKCLQAVYRRWMNKANIIRHFTLNPHTQALQFPKTGELFTLAEALI